MRTFVIAVLALVSLGGFAGFAFAEGMAAETSSEQVVSPGTDIREGAGGGETDRLKDGERTSGGESADGADGDSDD